jgi:hypothetical protein
MRRNILAYKAPPNNEGYDLICIHPEPRKVTKQIRVQVKSRYQTDSNLAVPVKARTFDAFDYLVVAFLNIGYFYRRGQETRAGFREPEFYTLPREFVMKHHRVSQSGWDRLILKGLNVEEYKNEVGFEQIANALEIPPPRRVWLSATNGSISSALKRRDSQRKIRPIARRSAGSKNGMTD